MQVGEPILPLLLPLGVSQGLFVCLGKGGGENDAQEDINSGFAGEEGAR